MGLRNVLKVVLTVGVGTRLINRDGPKAGERQKFDVTLFHSVSFQDDYCDLRWLRVARPVQLQELCSLERCHFCWS